MHTMWKGSVSFGLVNVPVRMFAATESKDVKLRYLHKECKTPIQYTRTCPHCERAVDWEEIVRGFEYEPNRFVILDEDELKQISKPRSQTIDILDFVELAEIDPVYYDKTYYLAPETAGLKAYRLLQAAMQETGKIAIAKTVLRNAETLACVRTHDNLLLVETLFWPDEVRATSELPNVAAVSDTAVDNKELEMAVLLVNQLAGAFAPDKYVDERRSAIEQLIERKVTAREVEEAPATQGRATNIVDLMEALQASLRKTETAAEEKAKGRARPRKAPGTGKATAKGTDAASMTAPATKRAGVKRTAAKRSS